MTGLERKRMKLAKAKKATSNEGVRIDEGIVTLTTESVVTGVMPCWR